jgi:plasmid stabilization system protein ParE
MRAAYRGTTFPASSVKSPRLVVFRELNDAIRILVVRHERRHPDYGLERV